MAVGKRKKSNISPAAALVAPLQGLTPGLVTGVGLIALLLGGGYYAWHHWGRAAVDRPEYRVSVDSIDVTPPPAWIKGDVKGEVVRDGSLNNLSSLDIELTYKVYRAFEMHAWVAKVNRVSKRPLGRVEVDLRYRRPVAWVEVPGGVLPIDEQAVLLPPADFSEQQVGDFIRISFADLSPWGPIGTAWGDPRIAGAARIAAALENDWQQLGLHRIRLSSALTATPSPQPTYELETRGGKRIVWGSAPGNEKSGEPQAAQKIQRLMRIAQRQGSLEQNAAPPAIDLRDPNAETSGPRTPRGK